MKVYAHFQDLILHFQPHLDGPTMTLLGLVAFFGCVAMIVVLFAFWIYKTAIVAMAKDKS
jgi:hypothetical protein